MMDISTLAKLLGQQWQADNFSFQSISIDSRQLMPGALFIAIRGETFDGHDYLDAAQKAGAVAAIVSQPTSSSLPVIQVNDTHQALLDLASYWRSQFEIPVVGVTGSCGKTTTRALLASIFSQCGSTLAAEKSFNNEIGVPLTLLRLRASHEFAVIEMGANHPGEIALLTHVVKPSVAIITNAAPAHLEGFGDIEGVACAKGEIFQGLGVDGVAVINEDDQFASYWHTLCGSRKKIGFALQHAAEVRAEHIAFDEQGRASFDLLLADERVAIKLPLMGGHNVNNALAAASAAHALGVSAVKIQAGLLAVAPEKRRLVPARGYADAMIIDDSYNANPLSVMAAIDVLKNQTGSSVLVFADMLELGEHSDELHRQIGKKASDVGISHLFCYGPLSVATAKAFGKAAQHFEDKGLLIEAVRNVLSEDVTVLTKGSNSMGMDQVTAALLN